jgi:hypothetical protein
VSTAEVVKAHRFPPRVQIDRVREACVPVSESGHYRSVFRPGAPVPCCKRREGSSLNMFGEAHQAEWMNLAELASKEMDATKLLAVLTELNHRLEHGEREMQFS